MKLSEETIAQSFKPKNSNKAPQYKRMEYQVELIFNTPKDWEFNSKRLKRYK